MTDENTAVNPFDFNNVADLPEDLQKRLHTETNNAAAEFADVVVKGKEAGHDELNINQIMAAASRLGIEVPTQQTVRGYLNKAVDMGLLEKPTRQTYAVAAKAKGKRTKAEDTGLAEGDAVATAEVEATDPLADLG